MNLAHNIHLAIGGLFVVLGAILSLNGKRLLDGIFIKGWKHIPIFLRVLIPIITFTLLYFWFNSIFEVLSGDVNNIKIILLRISSVGLAALILIGIIQAKTVFGIKSTRY